MAYRTPVLVVICLTAVLLSLAATVSADTSGDPAFRFKEVLPDFTVHQLPAGRMVVFMAMNTNSMNIFLCGPDGKITRLLAERRTAKYPSPSADGRRVYFESSEDIPYTGVPMTDEERALVDNDPLFLFQIYTLNTLTGQQTRISDGNTLDSFPVASPDGSRVAFCSRLPSNASRWNITLMDHDGTNRQPLNPDTDDSQLWPAWSPDAQKVAYVSSKMVYTENGRPPQRKMALMIHDMQTGSTRTLPTGEGPLNEPSWSPLGDWIAFTRFDMKTASYTLWKIHEDGSGLQRITDGPEDHHASWLPDGQAMLFARGIEKGGGRKEICIVNIKTGQISRVISASDASLEFPHVYPAILFKGLSRL